MKANGKDMFTDARFADHRAPMTRSQAYRNGVVAGIIGGVLIGLGAATLFLIVIHG